LRIFSSACLAALLSASFSADLLAFAFLCTGLFTFLLGDDFCCLLASSFVDTFFLLSICVSGIFSLGLNSFPSNILFTPFSLT